MENPKCPECDGPSEKEYFHDGFLCQDNDCHTSFIVCPFCQQCLALYRGGEPDHCGCRHAVVYYPCPPRELYWLKQSEEKAFNNLLEKKRQQQIDEEKLPFLEKLRLEKEEWEKEREQALQDGEDPEDWEEYWDGYEWTDDDDERAGEMNEEEVFYEYAKERGFISVYISHGVRHAQVSQTFYLLEHPPKK